MQAAISFSEGPDFDCDGNSDILLKGRVVLGGETPTSLRFELGALASGDLKEYEGDVTDWGQVVGIGDVNGDGCDDALVSVTPIQHEAPISRIPIPILFYGRPGLASTWQAARRLTHDLIACGDLNADGYGDTAECTPRGCLLQLGGPSFQTDAPGLSLNGYRLLVSGDFNGDGLSDFWAARGQAGSDDELSFFPGKPEFALRAAASVAMPRNLTGAPSLGLIVNGQAAVFGITRKDGRDAFWQTTESAKLSLQPWPTRYLPRLGAQGWQVMAWEFIPLTGPGGRGIFVVLPGRSEMGWNPTQSFLQYGVSRTGAPFYLGEMTIPELERTDSVVGFARAGDLNGDGQGDLIVKAIDDSLGGELAYECLGSAAGFKYKQRL